MRRTGAEHLADALTDLGVDVAFGLPGVHNLPVWESLTQQEIRLIGVRHEQTAGYAADGYARATGGLGVAIVTTGPGAANTLAAVGEANASGTPLLVIATDIPSTLRRPGVVRGVLHENSDQQAMFGPVCKATHTVTEPGEIAPAVRWAAAQARRPQSGPVYLGIPADFLRTGCEPAADVPDDSPELPLPDLDAAAEALSRADRPLIWAGGGALRSGAGVAIGELARTLAAPVLTTYSARGLLPIGHPCLAANSVHTPEVGTLWDEADVVLAVGTDFDAMMTQNWRMPAPPELITINIDAQDAAKNYPPQHLLTGDADTVVRALSAKVRPRPGLGMLSARLGGIAGAVRRSIRAEEPQAADLLSTLEEVLPTGAKLVCDMCVAGYWVGGFHRIPGPRRLAYPMGWGTLGFGFPASVGTALAGTGRAVCITGDGGFLYGCGDLATAAQERLPITVVLVDDGGYGMLRYDQDQAGVPRRGVDLVTPDFLGLARSFGVHADRVDGFGRAFRRLLGEFVRADGPNVLVVHAELKPPLNTSPRWYRTEN